jgi:hypothetical protein
MTTIHLFLLMLFQLIGWHALADFPLQGQFMSDAKNPFTPMGTDKWRVILPLHACIHGVGVALITGSLTLGILEAVIHGRIDYLRCANMISFERDQFLHLNCKFVWTLLAITTFH